MINYCTLKTKYHIFLSLTGLKVEEFESLIESFQSAWNNFAYEEFVKGKDRIRQYGGGNNPVLEAIEDKLLFILFYYKIYPIQELQGYLFGMSQESACDWIERLSKCLNKTLGYEKQLPERKKENWDTIFQHFPSLDIFIDGTERPINRPKKKQEYYYSGKKKQHTRKVVIVSDINRRIHFMTKTVEGKRHDKKITDDEFGVIPKGHPVWTDLGLQGINNPLNATIFIPKKKPKGGELSIYEKLNNANISRIRVKVEHAIAGVKISSIARDKFRNRREDFADEVMYNSVGLHNFRVKLRNQ
jgi:hypothetical protein